MQAKGVTYLCFSEDHSMFQGYLVTENHQQFGVSGKEGEVPTGNIDECIFDGDVLFYDVILMDYENDTEVQIRHVMRIGGDNCSLVSNKLNFRTDRLFVDEKAEELILKYFSPKLLEKGCYVCMGEMDFDCREGSDVGSVVGCI